MEERQSTPKMMNLEEILLRKSKASTTMSIISK